ncbi:phosphohydrolase [Clostridium acetobutylicum]|nr:phosphohydrolase [Clostridium acetobutylicum]
MWSYDKITDYLMNNLGEKRYKHSLGVMDTAVRLAGIYNEDTEKARIAGLVHDCAKKLPGEKIIEICTNEGYELGDEDIRNSYLLHGLAGRILAKKIIGIDDEDVLNAIEFHTTGRPNMSLLEKIIYIADYIEPGREFKGVDELRKAADEDLNKALLMSFDNTIKFVIDKGGFLHHNTIEARNYLISRKG